MINYEKLALAELEKHDDTGDQQHLTRALVYAVLDAANSVWEK